MNKQSPQQWSSQNRLNRESRDESMASARELKRLGFQREYPHLVCMARAENRSLVRRLRGI